MHSPITFSHLRHATPVHFKSSSDNLAEVANPIPAPDVREAFLRALSRARWLREAAARVGVDTDQDIVTLNVVGANRRGGQIVHTYEQPSQPARDTKNPAAEECENLFQAFTFLLLRESCTGPMQKTMADDLCSSFVTTLANDNHDADERTAIENAITHIQSWRRRLIESGSAAMTRLFTPMRTLHGLAVHDDGNMQWGHERLRKCVAALHPNE
jgi:hypothetical protein